MKQKIILRPEKPMEKVIDDAKAIGFKFDFRLNKFENVMNIQQWLADQYNLHVWYQPHLDGTFTPYVRDMRTTDSKKEKCAARLHHKEALVYGLRDAIRMI